MSPCGVHEFSRFRLDAAGIVLLLCTVSVLEIYSATLHTKYRRASTPSRCYWIVGGLVAMFIFSRIDYHRLLDWVPWAYGVCLVALLAVLVRIGHKALGARRWIKLGPMHVSAVGVDEAGADPGGGAVLRQSGGAKLTWKEIFKAFALVGVPMLLVLKQPDMGTALTYTPVLMAGLFLGGINLRQARS